VWIGPYFRTPQVLNSFSRYPCLYTYDKTHMHIYPYPKYTNHHLGFKRTSTCVIQSHWCKIRRFWDDISLPLWLRINYKFHNVDIINIQHCCLLDSYMGMNAQIEKWTHVWGRHLHTFFLSKVCVPSSNNNPLVILLRKS
jgi:hypothetical protein